jgi:hypothetical protein
MGQDNLDTGYIGQNSTGWGKVIWRLARTGLIRLGQGNLHTG